MSDNAGFYGPTVGNQPNTMQDYGNRRAEWGPASMDIRHNWISSCNYELPVGRGKRLLGDASGLANTVLGGWMTSGVLTFRTGLPLTIGETPDTSNAGSSSPRPDAIRNGNLPRGSRGPDNWFDTTAYARARRPTRLAMPAWEPSGTPASPTSISRSRSGFRSPSLSISSSARRRSIYSRA